MEVVVVVRLEEEEVVVEDKPGPLNQVYMWDGSGRERRRHPPGDSRL